MVGLVLITTMVMVMKVEMEALVVEEPMLEVEDQE
jgi:hypothetical protein